jgi:hypothetical protein
MSSRSQAARNSRSIWSQYAERVEPFFPGLAEDVLRVLVIAHDEQRLEPGQRLYRAMASAVIFS